MVFVYRPMCVTNCQRRLAVKLQFICILSNGFFLKNAKHRNYSTDFLFVQLAFGKEKDCGMGALGI